MTIKKKLQKEVKEDKLGTDSFIIFQLEKDEKGNLLNIKITRNEINLLEEIGLLENHLAGLKITPVFTKLFNQHLNDMENEMNLLLQLGNENIESLVKN